MRILSETIQICSRFSRSRHWTLLLVNCNRKHTGTQSWMTPYFFYFSRNILASTLEHAEDTGAIGVILLYCIVFFCTFYAIFLLWFWNHCTFLGMREASCAFGGSVSSRSLATCARTSSDIEKGESRPLPSSSSSSSVLIVVSSGLAQLVLATGSLSASSA